MNIKKNDMVVVITGSDKGKKGAVVDILSKKGKIKVQNVAVVTRHLKARRQGEKPGIRKQERWIDVSNVKIVCPKCGKAARVGYKIEDKNKKRICK